MLELFFDVHVVDVNFSKQIEPVACEQFVNILFDVGVVIVGVVEDFVDVLHLDDNDFDVHLVEGNRAKDLEFGPLNVEAEEMNRGPVQSEQNCVEWKTLK